MMQRYAIVIEKAAFNYAAYVPDQPGCVATGATVEETEQLLREAISLHLDGLQEDGLPIPCPSEPSRRAGIRERHAELAAGHAGRSAP